MDKIDKAKSPIKATQVFLPVIIGLVVIAWLFAQEFKIETLQMIDYSSHLFICILLAIIFMFGRDLGHFWRFRVITDKHFKWHQAIRVNYLCEFTSAVTPSAVGGSSFAILYMYSEGLSLGRSTTLVMATLFLDELFFVITCPIVIFLIPYSDLFGFNVQDSYFITGLSLFFWLVYAGITIWTIILFFGLFIKPRAVAQALAWAFRFRPLRRWQHKMITLGDNMQSTSVELKRHNFIWWLKAFAATSLSWLSRYMVVNALFWGFAPYADQIIIFGRQVVVWVVLMISPTPGGSGISEWIFAKYYGDLLNLDSQGITLIIALFWRIISYYAYLIIGACLLPGLLRRLSQRNSQSSDHQISHTDETNY